MKRESLQRVLAEPRTTFQMCLLGMLGGLFAATLIILLRLIIIKTQSLFTPQFDNFVEMNAWVRFVLPITGALLIGLFAYFTGFRHYRMGIPLVIHRMKTRYGLMPIRNTLNQFFGSVISLSSGFSVGREGPSVHIGAAGSSYLGLKLQLPYNAIRTLSGCGIAAGISASFNTPLAAVVFVMEVVLREYKIHVFVPIMLASVVGALATQLVFGDLHEMARITFYDLSFWHYPYIAICGLVIGAIAYGFNRTLMAIIQGFRWLGMFPRLMLAAVITAVVGIVIPHAMGAEASAIHFAVSSPTDISFLLMILGGKLIATLFAIGLGVPGGLLGPLFGIGVLIGTLLSTVLVLGFDVPVEVAGSYALLGLAGLMAATLHAPLAALVAVIELTYNPELTVPAMIVIVSAYVCAAQVFKNRSIFLQQLDYQKLSYEVPPVKDALQRICVIAEMEENVKILENPIEAQIKRNLDSLGENQYLIIKDRYEVGSEYRLAYYDVSSSISGEHGIKYWPLIGISVQSTLAEAFELLQQKRDGAVYIYDQEIENFVGLIRWDQLRNRITKHHSFL
ncbi:chloride channel protein [Algicola sagamiensis]|uniref:chloride channel protein n=1 Tax=Algicola sagamiensis TaxID=163869 RepID=UPI00036EC7FF|nr:chloride channel protein [Algicola sagamiensis]